MKKIQIIVGHYGSGKTNIAVNLAIDIKNKVSEEVTLVDLDIVNPYFRAADNKDLLIENGIRPILPRFANTNVDIPTPPVEIKSVFDTDCYSVFDVGGDDDGAIVLSVYKELIKNKGYEMYFVYNAYRPLISDVNDAFALLKRIEAVSGLSFSGIINNSNLGFETDKKTVFDSIEKASELSEISSLPIVFTSVSDVLSSEDLSFINNLKFIKNVTKQLF